MKYAEDLVEGGAWVFDPMAVCHWDLDLPLRKDGKHCSGCVQNGMDYEFPVGELKACGSGFCRGLFCGDCRDNDFASMADDWRYFVTENAEWMVGLAPQKEAEDSEEYNYEYLNEAVEEAVKDEDEKRIRSWCVTCFLASHKCDVGNCKVRAMVNGNCMGPTHFHGMQGKLKRKRVAESESESDSDSEDGGEGSVGGSFAVKSCTVSQVARKKLRVTIDLTL